MPIDDRKRRILMAVVSLYGEEGEPVGSSLLSRYFNMAVSSATLRNEMAALTRLGLLDQPHTSAGRIPTAKGYRYYVDNLLGVPDGPSEADRNEIDEVFKDMDYDPEKLAQQSAKTLGEHINCAVVVTTPRSDDLRIAHFEVIQVGRYTAAILAVTSAGGVSTRVAKVDYELSIEDVEQAANVLNRSLRFVTAADVTPSLVMTLVDRFESMCRSCRPILSAALKLLSEVGKPSTYIEGQQYFLRWPDLSGELQNLMELFNSPDELQKVIQPQGFHTTVRFGEEMPIPIPELCIISRKYMAGGGLTGILAVAGPARMNFRKIIPQIEYFGEKLGQSMSNLSA
ncbi:MAG: heat-inducible transcriptional repressor HrcA [Oscillospiraceae bacterium]